MIEKTEFQIDFSKDFAHIFLIRLDRHISTSLPNVFPISFLILLSKHLILYSCKESKLTLKQVSSVNK